MERVNDISKMTCDEAFQFWNNNRVGRKKAAFIVGDNRKGYTNIAAKVIGFAVNYSLATNMSYNATTRTCYWYAAKLSFDSIPDDVRQRNGIVMPEKPET